MNQKLKVIFVTDGIFPFSVGGMQRHSRLLIEALAKTGECDLMVIHPHEGKKIFENHSSITEIPLPFKKPESQFQYLLHHYRYSKRVYRVLMQHPEAVIYSQGLAVWYRISDVKHRLIINPHGLEAFQVMTLKEKMITILFRWLHIYLFRHAARVVSLGGRLTGILTGKAGVDKSKIVILPNAVNMPPPVHRSFNKPVTQFIFVGRFAFNKGIDVLMEAIKKANDSGYSEKTKFILVGKGPEYDRITALYKEPNVVFAGGADDETLFRLYRESDVFVLPTLFEGMPTVALEAMSYGLPVIITDTGATLELAGADNALIIEKRSVDSLAGAIKKMTDLPAAEKQKMSAASISKVSSNFTWPVVAANHLNVFRKLKHSYD
jgi:glycosyltransferase involved in cell wall biosynthesis